MSRDIPTKDALTVQTRPGAEGPSALSGARVPTLTIIAHPDARRVGERAQLVDILQVGAAVALSRGEPAFAPPSLSGFSPLTDPHISRRPVVLTRLPDGGVHVDVSKTGTRVVLAGAEIGEDGGTVSASALNVGATIELAGRVGLLLALSEAARPHTDDDDLGMLGASQAIQRVRDDVRRVADTDVPVMIRGETGTGKELVAVAIHHLSRRSKGPFVGVNMGSIPHTLAASQLFGHAKGAFSGAGRAHKGFFSEAGGGTLFLDEIGETPPEVQVMLLRTVESGELRPVGAERTTRADVRLVTATDRDLEEAAAREAFRAPLYHRLAGFVITVPALRERRGDIARLFHGFVRSELAAIGEADKLDGDPEHSWLPPGLMSRLYAYDWPGNVRELKNVARQIAIASRGRSRATLSPYLEKVLAPRHPEVPAGAARAEARPRRPSSIGEDELIEALRANGWQIAPTAAQLGLARASVYDLIARSDRIRKASDLAKEEICAASEASGGSLPEMASALEVSERGLLLRMRELGLR